MCRPTPAAYHHIKDLDCIQHAFALPGPTGRDTERLHSLLSQSLVGQKSPSILLAFWRFDRSKNNHGRTKDAHQLMNCQLSLRRHHKLPGTDLRAQKCVETGIKRASCVICLVFSAPKHGHPGPWAFA
ncbi:hypothetical protein CORC01_06953 [Colletotrichum orchidophilum]|uniref:Uncharacterized protein n=1 Tax=Colletotrichum orchidophilum TaxID=1209926 RepID=A0A1G4B8G5_9PEZI|nr:uncharacterized protein CORC01_06953 [Colletotrichum orchidophilum]OHE97748.1 hypothetical protein CORC01_06953 [Colletotrichum orchidophilum]